MLARRSILLVLTLGAMLGVLPGCRTQEKERSTITIETEESKHELEWETTDKDPDDD
jgi:hypothetical protein